MNIRDFLGTGAVDDAMYQREIDRLAAAYVLVDGPRIWWCPWRRRKVAVRRPGIIAAGKAHRYFEQQS